MIPPPAPPSSARRKITTSSEITYPPRANLPWAGFVGNRLPAGQTDAGRDAVSFLSVGAAACPDALEFHTQKRQSVSLPCVGGGGPRLRGSEGVYGSNFVGDYRTIASSKPIAFTPSVATNVATAPPTQGSLFLCPGGFCGDFYRSDIAAQRARHASPLQCHAGTFHRPYRAPPGDLRFSSKNHHRPREKSRGRWLQKERGKL